MFDVLLLSKQLEMVGILTPNGVDSEGNIHDRNEDNSTLTDLVLAAYNKDVDSLECTNLKAYLNNDSRWVSYNTLRFSDIIIKEDPNLKLMWNLYLDDSEYDEIYNELMDSDEDIDLVNSIGVYNYNARCFTNDLSQPIKLLTKAWIPTDTPQEIFCLFRLSSGDMAIPIIPLIKISVSTNGGINWDEAETYELKSVINNNMFVRAALSTLVQRDMTEIIIKIESISNIQISIFALGAGVRY